VYSLRDIYDVLILGAGASGLMCAAHLDESLHVAMLDTNPKVAAKLKISGGGKCNITSLHVDERNYDGDEGFISYALSMFSKDDLLEYLKQNSLEIELRKNRYYFCKNSSDDIINILKQNSLHVDKILNTKIISAKKTTEIFEVKTDKKILKAKKLIVATGGKSFATLGASEIGLEIAKSFALKVKEFSPALVGLTLQKEQFWMKDLSGLSCAVSIKVADKILKEDLLFAHKGISGPAILSASLYWRKGEIEIDFLPNNDIFELIDGSKKLLSSSIPLPKRLCKAILKALHVEDIECRKIDKDTREKLKQIHSYKFAPAGNFGFSKAEVSRGGVVTDELNLASFEALHVDGLYFIGEVVDVTGELGGYNFQWAFSSAVVCAREINTKFD
jgi:predicted Rossmann fold flavoprotein